LTSDQAIQTVKTTVNKQNNSSFIECTNISLHPFDRGDLVSMQLFGGVVKTGVVLSADEAEPNIYNVVTIDCADVFAIHATWLTYAGEHITEATINALVHHNT